MEQGRIHSVDLLEMAVHAALRLGYCVREDTPEGVNAGVCKVKGRTCVFLDPRSSPRERLQVVLDALRDDNAVLALPLPLPLLNVIRGAAA